MPGQQELQVQQKREVEKAQEATRPMRAFLPNTDIFETEDALTLVRRCRAWIGKISI
jgi:HSP20 family protein